MVTLQPPVRFGAMSFLLEFSSNLEDPTFYIYADGVLIAETKQNDYILAAGEGENIFIEVLDDAEALPMQVFPGKARLCWFGADETIEADYYRVDEYSDSQWTPRASLPENGGYLAFESGLLDDGKVHRFRIVPVGVNGNEGQAKEFAILVVRYPDEPSVNIEYSSITKKITITE